MSISMSIKLPDCVRDIVQSYLDGSFSIECSQDKTPRLGSTCWLVQRDGIAVGLAGSAHKESQECIFFEFPREIQQGTSVSTSLVHRSMQDSLNGAVFLGKRNRDGIDTQVYTKSIPMANKALLLQDKRIDFMTFSSKSCTPVLHEETVLGATSCPGRYGIFLDANGALWVWSASGHREKIDSPLLDRLDKDKQTDLFIHHDYVWILQGTRVWYRWLGSMDLNLFAK